MFHRSQRLFLRPPFPEDRAAIAAAVGDACRAEAIVRGAPGRDFVLVLPEAQDAPVIGAASVIESEKGLELCVRIAAPFEGAGYTEEAAQAVSEIFHTLERGRTLSAGSGAMPARELPVPAFDPSCWCVANLAPGQGQSARFAA